MTIKDIARESGYAVGTVSRVMNNAPGVSQKARARIMDVVDKYGFVLNSNAKELKQQVRCGIAVIVKGNSHALFAAVLEHTLELLSETAYPSSVIYIDEDANEVQTALRINREKKPQGILFLGANNSFFDSTFCEIEVPCVVITGQVMENRFSNLSSVTIDDVSAGEAAVDVLLDAGHRRIGVIGGNAQISETSQLRLSGCVNSHSRHGVEFDPERQLCKARFSYASGYAAMKELLDRLPDMTAVFAMSDTMAIGAIRALCDAGLRVPEDISVIGFDGLEIAQYYNPKLSTIRQDAVLLAESSVQCVRAMIEDKAAAEHIIVPFSVVQGDSVAAVHQRLS